MKRCDLCGKPIEFGRRKDDLPNGMTFILKDGRRVSICTDCFMMHPDKLDAWKEGAS